MSTLNYSVSATLKGVRRSTVLTLPDHYAVTGLDEREAQLQVDNTYENYLEFYAGSTDDDDVLGADWEEVEIEFLGVNP